MPWCDCGKIASQKSFPLATVAWYRCGVSVHDILPCYEFHLIHLLSSNSTISLGASTNGTRTKKSTRTSTTVTMRLRQWSAWMLNDQRWGYRNSMKSDGISTSLHATTCRLLHNVCATFRLCRDLWHMNWHKDTCAASPTPMDGTSKGFIGNIWMRNLHLFHQPCRYFLAPNNLSFHKSCFI